jgi:Uma2 family endonuclease
MSEARNEIWSLADFLAWEGEQERRHEFVDGRPRMMTGGTQAHAVIAANVVSLLRPMLRGSPCRPTGSDLRVPIPANGNSRYPDVTIDCGPFDPAARNATEPTVVFEVLSKSTAWYDQTQKVRDYESVETIRQYVCISQSEARVTVWLRDRDGRFAQQPDIAGGELTVLASVAPIRLPLSGIYEDTGVPSSGEASPS